MSSKTKLAVKQEQVEKYLLMQLELSKSGESATRNFGLKQAVFFSPVCSSCKTLITQEFESTDRNKETGFDFAPNLFANFIPFVL